jgi:Uma2 family endonuclease
MKPQLAEDDCPPKTLSMGEYLSTVWRPDCDFVDGRSEDRNIGEYNHSRMVMGLIAQLADQEDTCRVFALPSLRLRVAPARVWVADLCLIQRGGPVEQVPTHPPLAVFEVLSGEDRFSRFLEKLEDYRRFGVGNIWVIDPDGLRAYRYDTSGLAPVHCGELTVAETPIRIDLAALFAELD